MKTDMGSERSIQFYIDSANAWKDKADEKDKEIAELKQKLSTELCYSKNLQNASQLALNGMMGDRSVSPKRIVDGLRILLEAQQGDEK